MMVTSWGYWGVNLMSRGLLYDCRREPVLAVRHNLWQDPPSFQISGLTQCAWKCKSVSCVSEKVNNVFEPNLHAWRAESLSHAGQTVRCTCCWYPIHRLAHHDYLSMVVANPMSQHETTVRLALRYVKPELDWVMIIWGATRCFCLVFMSLPTWWS